MYFPLLRSLAVPLALSLVLAGCAADDGEAPPEDETDFDDEDLGGDAPADDETELSEDATPMERAVAYLNDAKAFRVRLVEADDDSTDERDHYHDEARRVDYLRLQSTHVGAATREPQTVARVGETAFHCEGECSLIANGVANDSMIPTLLFSERATVLISAGMFYLVGSDPESVTYAGVAALKYTMRGTDGRPPSYVWLQEEPVRFLRGEIVQYQGEDYPLKFINTTFTYTDAPPVEMLRAETLTLVNDVDAKAYRRLADGYEDGLSHWNFTFPTVTSPPSVPLADVTLTVLDRYDDGITMSLETLTAADTRIRVTFEDTDANGMVSAGDVLRIEVLDAGSSSNPFGVEDLDVRLVDEKGWTVVPGR